MLTSIIPTASAYKRLEETLDESPLRRRDIQLCLMIVYVAA